MSGCLIYAKNFLDAVLGAVVCSSPLIYSDPDLLYIFLEMYVKLCCCCRMLIFNSSSKQKMKVKYVHNIVFDFHECKRFWNFKDITARNWNCLCLSTIIWMKSLVFSLEMVICYFSPKVFFGFCPFHRKPQVHTPQMNYLGELLWTYCSWLGKPITTQIKRIEHISSKTSYQSNKDLKYWHFKTGIVSNW